MWNEIRNRGRAKAVIFAAATLLSGCEDDACGGNRERAEVSLDRYCAEFDCPSYEELATMDQCSTYDTGWDVTRHEGCGQVLFESSNSITGWTYVYDAESRELVGASSYNDGKFGSCGAFEYSAGAPPDCSEGTICSLCGETQECLPACSVEVLEARWLAEGGNAIRRDDVAQVAPCEAGTLRLEATFGCGRVTVETGGAFSQTYVFDAETDALVGYHTSGGNAEDRACGGSWGEAEPSCADAITCSLCSEDANACAF